MAEPDKPGVVLTRRIRRAGKAALLCTATLLVVLGGGRIVAASAAGGAAGATPASPAPAAAVSPVYLGLTFQMLTADLARTRGLSPPGALVNAVEAGSPAEAAGVQAGDLVVAVDGQVLDGQVPLDQLIQGLPDGQPATLRVIRGASSPAEQALTLTATPARLAPVLPPTAGSDFLNSLSDLVRGPRALPLTPLRSVADMGVQLQPITPQLAQEKHLTVSDGLLVIGVQPGGAAEQAGLEVGDVIRTWNGGALGTTLEFQQDLLLSGPGAEVRLGVLRDGWPISLSVTLGWRLSADSATPWPPAWLGVSFQAVSDSPRGTDTPGIGTGAYISTVIAGSPAQAAGLVPGDTITAVDRHALSNAYDLRALVQQHRPGETILLTLIRGGQEIQVQATLGKWPDTLLP